MNTYIVETRYESLSGNLLSNRQIITASSEEGAFNIARNKIRKHKNFCKIVEGNIVAVSKKPVKIQLAEIIRDFIGLYGDDEDEKANELINKAKTLLKKHDL